MDKVYAELREKGFSFEEMAEGNLEQMISWKLSPVLAPEEFARHYLERGFALARDAEASEFDISSGSAYNRFMAFGTRRIQMEHFAGHYPEIVRRPNEFRRFEPLRSLPTLVLPALFRAALAVSPGRRARPSDGHDIAHLTHGLSRCDLVSADAGMTQLIRDFRLAQLAAKFFLIANLIASPWPSKSGLPSNTKTVGGRPNQEARPD
ncbi:MAG TPA: hypothetical protein VH042_07850 [Solirubrobacterales bacterium]|nr:hypothetical protein [Solirubrobacterales bacterium]